MSLDKVTLEVLNNYTRATAESMAYVIMRTAHSTFIKETLDFAAALVTPEGEIFAYPSDLGVAVYLGADLAGAIKTASNYEEGDIIISNDPYTTKSLATHLPDIQVWKPIFYNGKVVCYSWVFMHCSDIGGMVPNSISRRCYDIHQEGLRIPPQKLCKAGMLDEDLLGIIKANSRTPEQIWGDIKAEIAALNTGERKVHDIIAKFGLNIFQEGMYDLLSYTEERCRAIIAEIPDGEYQFASYIDNDVVSDMPIRLNVTVTVNGDNLHIDYSGTDPQVRTSYNLISSGKLNYYHTTFTTCYFLSMDKTIPRNGGVVRPITVTLPKGSLVNAEFPAACGIRNNVGMHNFNAVLGCLTQAMPHKLPASPSTQATMVAVSVTDPKNGRQLVNVVAPMLGGGGGTPDQDGVDACSAELGFVRNTPVESLEAEIPIIIRRYEMIRDSGGAGKHRSGLGTRLDFQVFQPNSVVTTRGVDRTRFRPWGVHSGRCGTLTRMLLNPSTRKEKELGLADWVELEPGDIFSFSTPGGGGYGSPLERDPDAVLTDLQSGFISCVAARDLYGVVIENNQIQWDATKRLRAELVAKQKSSMFDFGTEREEYEATWSAPIYDALTEIILDVPHQLRTYVKKQIWEEIKGLSKQRTATPDDVRAIWDRIKSTIK